MKKFASVGVAAVTAVTMTGVFTPAQAQSVDINALLAQIAQLQALVAQLQAAQGGSSVGTSYTFTKNLTLGSTGDEVKALQQFLNANGAQVAATGAGSPGNETMYFGPATRAALAKWQAANGVSPASGYFGPITRTKIASLGGGTSTGGGVVVVPTESFLKVESVPMAAASIPSSSLYNKVLGLKLTAGKDGATVTGLTVARGGYVANTNISGVSIWDDAGMRYGNILTALTADGKATFSFGSSPIMLGAGQSKTVYVAVSLGSGATSGTVNFSVSAASDVSVANSVPVQGTFPMTGTTFTLVDGSSSIADVYVDDVSVSGLSSTNGDGNLEVGQTDREVFKLRLTQNNSKEAVKFERVTLYFAGTARDNDLANWKLYSPEGNLLATAAKSDDRYVTFNLSTPYVIDKGLSKDFTVKVDIVDGSGYYFRVSIQNDYDLVVKGVTTGSAVQPKNSSGSDLTQGDTEGSSSYFKMKSGALTASKAAGSPSGNVAPSSQNAVLAKFDLKSSGEKLEIRKMAVQIVRDDGDTALTGTVTVKDAATGETYLSVSADTSGIQATSAPASFSSNQNLSSYITIESGQTKTLEVTGTVSANATSASNYTVYLGEFYTKRYSTNDYTTLYDSTVINGNQIAVGDVTLTVTSNAAFPNVNRSKGATNVKIAEVVLQASSADNVRITGINFNIASSSYIQNMKLMDGTTQLGSTIGSPSSSSNNFTTDLVINASESKVLSVYADVLSSATEGDSVLVSVADSGITGYGVNSTKTLSDTPSSDTPLQKVTIKTASITIAQASETPASKIVLAGQTGVELSKIKFEPSNEDLTLKKITLSLVNASSGLWESGVNQNVSKLYLYDGTTLLGSANIASGDAIISGLNLSMPQDTAKTLTVKADISGQDTINPQSVAYVQVKGTSTTDMEVYSSQGQMTSGITLTSNAAGNKMLFAVTAPVVTNALSGTTGNPSSNEEIGRFTISNPGTREMTVTSTSFVVTVISNGATSTLGTISLYESNDLGTALATSSGTSTVGTVNLTSAFTISSSNAIAAGASRTYVLKADTASIKQVTSTFTGNVKLTVKLDGTKGYSASDTTDLWNDGKVTYSYSTTGAGATTKSALTASDTAEVFGPTLTY